MYSSRQAGTEFGELMALHTCVNNCTSKSVTELDSRTLEEFLISGIVFRKWIWTP